MKRSAYLLALSFDGGYVQVAAICQPGDGLASAINSMSKLFKTGLKGLVGGRCS